MIMLSGAKYSGMYFQVKGFIGQSYPHTTAMSVPHGHALTIEVHSCLGIDGNK